MFLSYDIDFLTRELNLLIILSIAMKRFCRFFFYIVGFFLNSSQCLQVLVCNLY